MSDLRIERGDIFYVGLTPFVTGREQLAGRPGIIVSNDQNNLHSDTVEVVYCTTRYKPNLPTHTTVLSTPYESTVLCEQVTTVDISRLGNYIGRCTEKEMREIDRCIRVSLGLQEDKTVKSNPAYVPPMGNTQKESEEMIALRVERDTYRKMYEMVVEKLADMAIIAGGVKNGE